MGAHIDRLPPFPWKYTISARGVAAWKRQARSRSPSLVVIDCGSQGTSRSRGVTVSPVRGKNANEGSMSRTNTASASTSPRTASAAEITRAIEIREAAAATN